MYRDRPSKKLRKARILGGFSLAAAAGAFLLPLSASSVEVEHQVLEIEDALGPPAIQAAIVACIGEQVFFTGTVRITLVDGVPTHYNWGGMIGETAGGTLFVGGSGVTIGQQSNLTLAEVGGDRLFHLQFVGGTLIAVVCH